MSPQPLSRVRPNLVAVWSPRCFAQEPELAAGVMEVLATWSEIEWQLLVTTATFLEADLLVVASMLAAITSSDGQRAATLAAARIALNDDDFLLFRAVRKFIEPVRTRRHEYAHHIWGYVPELPGALVLLDPKYAQLEHAKFETRLRSKEPRTGKPPIDPSRYMVFRKGDIQADIHAAREAHAVVRDMRTLFIGGSPRAEQRRQRLLDRPRLQQILQSMSNESAP